MVASRLQPRRVVSLGLFALIVAVAALACDMGGGGGGGGGGKKQGTVALLLKDAPITTSDGRPADEVNIEILGIELERDGDDVHDDENDGHDDADDDDDEGDDEDDEDEDDEEVTVFDAPPGSGITVNLLDLDVPLLLMTVSAPTGKFEEVELRLNPANATIHFTDVGSTESLAIADQGEDEAEVEFEFDPPLTVSAKGVTNALIDFAPVVFLDGTTYVLSHDDEDDETGEVDDDDGEVDEVEVEGLFQGLNGDVVTIESNGTSLDVDVSLATEFEVDGASVSKADFLAALGPGVEVEAEGTLASGVLVADEAEADTTP